LSCIVRCLRDGRKILHGKRAVASVHTFLGNRCKYAGLHVSALCCTISQYVHVKWMGQYGQTIFSAEHNASRTAAKHHCISHQRSETHLVYSFDRCERPRATFVDDFPLASSAPSRLYPTSSVIGRWTEVRVLMASFAAPRATPYEH